jgi:drug/metabolite transporter (DMT)-like permease
VALAAGLLAPATWGLTGVFVRLLHGLPTSTIVTGRLVIAALFLTPWALRRYHTFPEVFRSPLAAAMSAYYIFATEAFVRAPVVEVTLLVGSAPVIAVGLEQARGLRPVRQQVIGAIVAVLGLVIFLRPDNKISHERAFGYIFALCAAAASAAYAVGLRARAQSQRPLDPLALTVFACVIGSVASSLLLGRSMFSPALALPNPTEFVYLAILGSVCTAFPTLAFGVASARLPSVLTTSLGLMTPLFAALFAALLLHEWPALAAAPGAVIAIAGVVMVLRSPRISPPRS